MKIVIRGRPGVGKTTAVIKLATRLESLGFPLAGFYTEELMEDTHRIGFRVATLHQRAAVTFAHVNLDTPHKVGRYSVDVDSFERVALPSLDPPSAKEIVIVDEIGKMELFSKRFQGAMEELFSSPNTVVATIPTKPISFVRNLLRRSSPTVMDINFENRETIVDEIISLIEHE